MSESCDKECLDDKSTSQSRRSLLPKPNLFRSTLSYISNKKKSNDSNTNDSITNDLNASLLRTKSLREVSARRRFQSRSTSSGVFPPPPPIISMTRSVSTLDRRVSKKNFKDLIVNSKGNQTVLTKEPLDNDNDVEESQESLIQFSFYLPEILKSENTSSNVIQSSMVRPQLTNGDMNQIQSRVLENESLKKECNDLKNKLKEESKHRIYLQKQLDEHNDKVRQIMESLERKMNRDEQFLTHEEVYKKQIFELTKELEEKQKEICVIKKNYEDLVALYRESENESSELHEFLQAEKSTLSEALKEVEVEIEELKKKYESKLREAEERVSHLVRLGEQRHQEILTLKEESEKIQNSDKELLSCLNAEISRAIDELLTKLRLRFGLSLKSKNVYTNVENENISFENDKESETFNVLNGSPSLADLSNAILKRKKSWKINNSSSMKHCKEFSLLVDLTHRIFDSIDMLDDYSKKIRHGSCPDINGVFINENFQKQSELSYEEMEMLYKTKEMEVKELKNTTDRLLRHRTILQHNYNQSEAEVREIDDIYHSTMGDVLEVFQSNLNVIHSNNDLNNLMKKLECYLTGQKPKERIKDSMVF